MGVRVPVWWQTAGAGGADPATALACQPPARSEAERRASAPTACSSGRATRISTHEGRPPCGGAAV